MKPISTGRENMGSRFVLLSDPARMDIREKMAVCCRTLAARGHCSNLAGQVTALMPDAKSILAPPMGRSFAEMQPDDFIEVDFDFKALHTCEEPNPATLFHLWIYRARSDVRCIAHTHPPHASALSMISTPLEVAHMDMCMFYDDCAFLPEWPGVPIADDEGRIISEALGEKRAVLLANHGPLVAGASVEEATYLAVALEDAARLQLLAMAAGTIKPISASHGREAHDFLLQDSIVGLTFAHYVRDVRRSDSSFEAPAA